MSHYHQHQQQQHHFQQQQHPKMYNNNSTSYQQQQQQPQYEQPQHPAMAYNNLQMPVMFSMDSSIQGYNTAPTDLDCERTYFQGIGMSMPQDASSNCTTNNNSSICPPSLISIRRDSGFAPSLDELSLGIMASNNNQDREDFKGVLHTLQATAALQSSMMSSEIINNDNSSPSFFLSTPTSLSSSSPSSSPSTATINNTNSSSATPVITSMSFGIEYPLINEQRQFLQVQQQQQQHIQGPVAATVAAVVGDAHSSPSSPCTASTWNTDFSMMQSQQHQQQPTLLSPLQYHPRQGQIQHPRQRKPMLQIMTSTESEQQAMVYNSSMSPMSGPWESSSVTPLAASPSMSAANNIVRAGQYQQQQPQQQCNYPWGFVSSPVESSFSSGSSTPLFASPSSSYAHSDMAANSSCQSSRAASPSVTPSSLYENFLANERRIKRRNSECPNLIIRSRKSSTSSNSSMASQRRASILRGSALTPSSPATANHSGCSASAPATSASTGTHQCPKCGQRFAGPAVLVRHIESIHDKLLWNCVGCKSNLSRRDAVTRHINLSPMDSICRAVGTIGQIKTSNGAEVHYEISSYRAKPLDEVMNRMGKKISTTLRNEIDRSKTAALQQQQQLLQQQQQQQQHGQQYHPYQHQYQAMMMEDIEMLQEHDNMMEDELTKKRRRPSMVVDEALSGRKKKM
ncbi:hypothetical protein EC957_008470 [Mortierella hygrophila]|uniref:C2H2-type domain-containing protein n=1 Tax=Mortierella hygrophila TaxID=979708 RepID=A0A9P6FBE3_9FUNG|nr:hypothetical protein EC957_008470 [Mortierella hygrophila]